MPDTAPSRPPFDPELAALLAAMPELPPLSAESLPMVRPYASGQREPLLESREVSRSELTITLDDQAEIPITVIAPTNGTANAPCVLWFHGGGMVMGDRFSQIDIPLEWVDQLGVVLVSVDYRLAPEVSGTTPVEDAYAALSWVADHASELGIDTKRIHVAGTSAGGGVAAGTVLMARDRGTPYIAAQILICPMLDHRNATASATQFAGPGVWSRESNEFAWNALLGATSRVSIYASPAIAPELSGLPPTYVDVGSAEVFRDESVDYATRIWAAGGVAALHVWAGGFHGFDALFPDAQLSIEARATRTNWLATILAR